MTGHQSCDSPKLLKGGTILIDSESAAVRHIIMLQIQPRHAQPHFSGQGRRRGNQAKRRG